MSRIPNRPMATFASLIVTAMAVASCGVKSDASENGSGIAAALDRAEALAAMDRRTGGQDPCTLLSAAEAERYVGRLTVPPYRATDVRADVRGEACIYHGSAGRQLSILPRWSGGEMMGSVLRGVPAAVGGVLGKGAPGLDSLTNKVLEQGPKGPWDQATWIPGGTLTVTKGSAVVQIDMSGATGQQDDAVALARLIVPRIGHPLDYDGARAVALAPRPKPHPRNACDFLPRAAAEAAIGPLSGAPEADSDGTVCTYRVATAQGARAYPVGFTWEGGAKGYNMMKHGMSMLGGMLGTPTTTALDTMTPSGNMGKMLGGFMKMATGASGSSATGAVTTVRLKTDTTLEGPWDDASLLHGTQLMAVKGDVSVFMDLQSADYDKAKALLAAICSRL